MGARWIVRLSCAVALMSCAGDAAPQDKRTGARGGSKVETTEPAQNTAAPSDPDTATDNPNSPMVQPSTTPPAGAKPSSPGMPSEQQPAARVVIDQTGADNPAGLPAQDVTKLMAGGDPGKMRWLYPYDGTVFPRGMLAPTLMWDGDANTDAIYLHVHSNTFDYKTVVKPAVGSAVPLVGAAAATAASAANGWLAPQFQLPADVWVKACQATQGKKDPFTLELTARINGAVQGPVTEQMTIASANVLGSIYYSTSLGVTEDGTADAGDERVYRIRANGAAEPVLATRQVSQCHGCHTVSANGSRMVAQFADNGVSATAYSYQLNTTGVDVTSQRPRA